MSMMANVVTDSNVPGDRHNASYLEHANVGRGQSDVTGSHSSLGAQLCNAKG